MWQYYEYFAFGAILIFIITSIFSFIPNVKNRKINSVLTWFGLVLLSAFIIILWISLERPPMRTLGETRLWYSFFIMLSGVFIYRRTDNNWFLAYCALLSSVFLLINFLKPEIQSKTLMPALQSFWFIPHVIVYMLSYALLAQSAILSAKALYDIYKGREDKSIQKLVHQVVYAGFGLLSLGLIFGALWAKEAWGHYWTWDPKEIWALLTWLAYLIYIHYSRNKQSEQKKLYIILFLAFVILIICWFGIKYLPNAALSVHIYS